MSQSEIWERQRKQMERMTHLGTAGRIMESEEVCYPGRPGEDQGLGGVAGRRPAHSEVGRLGRRAGVTMLCPRCDSPVYEVKCKVFCTRCRVMVYSCADTL